jgi:hypothetical protein
VKKAAKGVLVLAILAGLTMSTGCKPWQATSSISFGVGWLLGDLAAATRAETACYLNGQLIDCADLPGNIQ